jgi:hypothetical protein
MACPWYCNLSLALCRALLRPRGRGKVGESLAAKTTSSDIPFSCSVQLGSSAWAEEQLTLLGIVGFRRLEIVDMNGKLM